MNLAQLEDRMRLIASIKSENNKARKQVGLRSSEVAGGRIEQFVKERLQGELSLQSVKEMPLVTSINVQGAITDKKATIYKKPPERYFNFVEGESEDAVYLIYKDMLLNQKLNRANKNYIYQNQTIGMIIPKGGKLICRIFKMDQIDAIPSLTDPESADGYILSVFDRTLYTELDTDKKDYATATGVVGRSNRSTASPDQNLEVAEKYQFQKYVEKYVVWTKLYNFMMNGLGEVLDPDTGEALASLTEDDLISPLASEGIMPFFEVAKDKDFEYFVRPSNALTDFTIQFNSMLSDLANNIKMNGYAVGVLKAPSELQPQNQIIGASMLLKLPTDDPDKVVDFQFASPSSNIGEISEAIDKFLNYFVTSEGVGSNVINSSGQLDKATSGIDRFLKILERVEAHADDYDAFKNAEHHIYEIIKAWLRVLKGSDQLDAKYQANIPEDSELEIKYARPEMVETESEKLANVEKKMDLGIMSRKQALMHIFEIEDEDKASEMLKEIQEEDMFMTPSMGVVNGTTSGEDDNISNPDESEA